MRLYHSYLSLSISWSALAILQAAVLQPMNVYVASVSGFVGFTLGVISPRKSVQEIEKYGAYRPSRNRILLVFGLAIAAVAALFYVIILEAIPLGILVQFYSVYTGLPAAYFGGAITFWRWESKNRKEIHSEGIWVPTLYAIPQGLSWQQKYEYRHQQQGLLRAKDSGEPFTADGPKASSIACLRCGTVNVGTARYCVACGTFLVAQRQQPTRPIGPQPPPYWYYRYPPTYADFRRAGQVDNTETGLLLLIIGVALSWVPFIGAVGGQIALIGAVFVILGREAFGPVHDRNVILSIILFIVGIAVTIVGAIIVFLDEFALQVGNPSGVSLPVELSSVIIVGGAITGLSEVLFTYALQKESGRAFLWLGYAGSIVIGLVNVLILPLGLSSGGTFFFPELFLLSTLLAVIPATLFATAFYLARDRIVRREIPSPTEKPPSFGTIGPTAPS